MLSPGECARVRLAFFMMVTLLSCSVARAKKPPNPPEPPPSVPGTIFFQQTFNAGEPTYYFEGWGMKADGSGKDTVLPSQVLDGLVNGVEGLAPSGLVYGDDPLFDRWWLGVKDLGLDPDTGRRITELFAFRPVVGVDGTVTVVEVQLTDVFPEVSVGLGTGHRPEWSNDGLDSFVSFKGGKTDWSGGVPVPQGTHLFRLNVSGLEIDQGTVVVPLGPDALESVVSTESGYEGNFTEHHWSPEGDRVVYTLDFDPTDEFDEDVYVTDLDSGATYLLWDSISSHGVGSLRWSPDGTGIAVTDYGDVWTVNPDDPSDFTLVVDGNTYVRRSEDACWSTDGSELVYCEKRYLNKKGGVWEYRILRVASEGGEPVDLSGGLDAVIPKRVLGWVSDLP